VIKASRDSEQKEVEKIAKNHDKINKYLKDKNLVKVIFVKNKILNFIVR
jgi:leucyl-tRNA synthetase